MQLTLEELTETLRFFTQTQSEFWTENCIVALESFNHASGCKMELKGDVQNTATLLWSKEITKKAGYKESNKYVEKGAEAISFLLAISLTEYDIVEEALIGEGFDYWLGYKEGSENYNEDNFLNARLEISGIGEESPTNKVEYRANKKKKQTNVSDDLKLPAYVSIVEFKSPKALFSKK